MVQFGEQLDSAIHEAWRGKYLPYRELKHQIAAVVKAQEKIRNMPEKSTWSGMNQLTVRFGYMC